MAVPVQDVEAAYLLLVARRVLAQQRAAAARGEVYHSLAPFQSLTCGLRARMVIEDVPGTYVLTLQILRTGGVEEEIACAESILEGDVSLVGFDSETAVATYARSDECQNLPSMSPSTDQS